VIEVAQAADGHHAELAEFDGTDPRREGGPVNRWLPVSGVSRRFVENCTLTGHADQHYLSARF
jgi:hypothetical protein